MSVPFARFVPGPSLIPKELPLLIEDAVDNIEAFLQQNFNAFLTQVWQDYANDGRKINLELVKPSSFYVSEKIKPYIVPAVFIIPQRTVPGGSGGLDFTPNWEYQEHEVLVGIVVEDREESRLARKRWRYYRAMRAALHERSFLNVRCLMGPVDYGIMIGDADRTQDRHFRTDATALVKVQHFERIGSLQ